MNVGWSVAILRVPTSLKTNSSRSNQNCSNHSSAVAFGSMFGSLLLTYRVTDFHGQAPAVSWKSDFDLRILVKSLEIICCSCEFLSLYPTTYLRLSPMEMSSGSELPISFTGDWRAMGRMMHGLAESGLGTIGRVEVAVRFGNDMHSVSRCTGRDLPDGRGQLQFLTG